MGGGYFSQGIQEASPERRPVIAAPQDVGEFWAWKAELADSGKIWRARQDPNLLPDD